MCLEKVGMHADKLNTNNSSTEAIKLVLMATISLIVTNIQYYNWRERWCLIDPKQRCTKVAHEPILFLKVTTDRAWAQNVPSILSAISYLASTNAAMNIPPC